MLKFIALISFSLTGMAFAMPPMDIGSMTQPVVNPATQPTSPIVYIPVREMPYTAPAAPAPPADNTGTGLRRTGAFDRGNNITRLYKDKNTYHKFASTQKAMKCTVMKDTFESTGAGGRDCLEYNASSDQGLNLNGAGGSSSGGGVTGAGADTGAGLAFGEETETEEILLMGETAVKTKTPRFP